MNIVPVLVHMESAEQFKSFLGEYPMFSAFQPVIANLLHVEDSKGERFYRALQVRRNPFGLLRLLAKGERRRVMRMRREGFSNLLTPPVDRSRVNSSLNSAVFMVERDAGVVSELPFNKWNEPADLIHFAIGPETPDDTGNSVSDIKEREEGDDDQEDDLNSGQLCSVEAVSTFEQVSSIIKLMALPSLDKKDVRQQQERYREQQRQQTPHRQSRMMSCFAVKTADDERQRDEQRNLKEPNRHWQMSSVLNNPQQRRYFKAFTSAEHSVENVLFWEQVTLHFKRIQSENRLEKARAIIETFFDPQALMGINTNKALLDSVVHELDQCVHDGLPVPIDLFDRVLHDVVSSVLTDSFSRFILSPLMQKALNSSKESTR